MFKIIKKTYHFIRLIYHKIKFLTSVNWSKTIFLNFKIFPFNIAKKLPVVIYGPIKLSSLKGKITINSPIKMGMISIGQDFEIFTQSRGISELKIYGELIFNGHMQMSNDCMIYISEKAKCTFGHMSMLGSNVKIICTNSILIDDWTNIGYDSQVSDSNYHPIKNTITGKHYPITKPIALGKYNYVSNRVTISMGASTPNNCVIASNSLVNKDYTGHDENILIGGIPAKLLKENYTRDYEYEKESHLKFLIKWHRYKDLL